MADCSPDLGHSDLGGRHESTVHHSEGAEVQRQRRDGRCLRAKERNEDFRHQDYRGAGDGGDPRKKSDRHSASAPSPSACKYASSHCCHATSCASVAGRRGQTGSHGAPKDRKSRTSCWTSGPRLSLPLSGSQDPSPIMGSQSGTMIDKVLRAHGAVRNDESQLRHPAERPLSLAFAVLNVLLMTCLRHRPRATTLR
jgi:hypothetical protein